MINIFNKNFDEIEYKDIENFISQRIPESLSLDYKGDILQTGKLPKAKEFGKDVSAFANTFGGWLLYGIATDEGDEVLPLEENAIVGIENQDGLKERIENMILSTVSPKPLYRMKKLKIPDTNRCLILIFVPQSYSHLHMVIARGENRFYKRFEYSSVPMDYFEIKNRFEEIGKGDKYRQMRVDNLITKISSHLPDVNQNNIFSLSATPKFLVENHFNNRQMFRQFFENNRDLYLNRYGRTPIYSLFYFNGVIDIRLQLKNIIGRKLDFITRDTRRYLHTSFTFDEEIDEQIITIEISELDNQRNQICEDFVKVLYYDRDLEGAIGLFNENGEPLYTQ